MTKYLTPVFFLMLMACNQIDSSLQESSETGQNQKSLYDNNIDIDYVMEAGPGISQMTCFQQNEKSPEIYFDFVASGGFFNSTDYLVVTLPSTQAGDKPTETLAYEVIEDSEGSSPVISLFQNENYTQTVSLSKPSIQLGEKLKITLQAKNEGQNLSEVTGKIEGSLENGQPVFSRNVSCFQAKEQPRVFGLDGTLQ